MSKKAQTTEKEVLEEAAAVRDAFAIRTATAPTVSPEQETTNTEKDETTGAQNNGSGTGDNRPAATDVVIGEKGNTGTDKLGDEGGSKGGAGTGSEGEGEPS